MAKIENLLPEFYAQLHKDGAFIGNSWQRHYHNLFSFLGGDATDGIYNHTILDYGCGPTGGLSNTNNIRYNLNLYNGVVVPYDPFVPEYKREPWKEGKLTAFFTCDVLEHMLLTDITSLLRRLCKYKTITHLFIALSTRTATKNFPNGVNVHLTVHPPEWWCAFFEVTLGTHFNRVQATAYLDEGEAVFCFIRKPEVIIPAS